MCFSPLPSQNTYLAEIFSIKTVNTLSIFLQHIYIHPQDYDRCRFHSWRSLYVDCYMLWCHSQYHQVNKNYSWSTMHYLFQYFLFCSSQTPANILQVNLQVTCLSSYSKIKVKQILCFRLMLLLAVIDTIFLITSALSFTFPHLNDNYADYTWMYLVPYTLPIAQVFIYQLHDNCSGKLMSIISDLSYSQCLHDSFTHIGEVLLSCTSFVSIEKKVS